jgi:hypothetical protein
MHHHSSFTAYDVSFCTWSEPRLKAIVTNNCLDLIFHKPQFDHIHEIFTARLTETAGNDTTLTTWQTMPTLCFKCPAPNWGKLWRIPVRIPDLVIQPMTSRRRSDVRLRANSSLNSHQLWRPTGNVWYGSFYQQFITASSLYMYSYKIKI